MIGGNRTILKPSATNTTTDSTFGPRRVIRMSERQTKDGRTFKGVCDLCDEEIYSGYDHDERCPYHDG